MTLFYLAIRNLKVFFKDKASVFFSLLGVIIIIGLYVLFLGDILSSSLANVSGNTRFLMDSCIMAGLLGVTSITTTMGAFGIMVEDRQKKIMKDFYTSPVRRSVLTGAYVLSSFIIGMMMCLLTLVLAEIYILAYGGEILSAVQFLKVLGILFISVLSSSAMVFFIVSFFRSNNAFATASTIIGTLVGFLTGIYIPIGSLPSSVQMAIKIFPVSHAGALLRQVMMEKPTSDVFSQAPVDMISSFQQNMGVYFSFGEKQLDAVGSIIILVASTLLFFGLAVLNISRKAK